jgi:hypothetical protein
LGLFEIVAKRAITVLLFLVLDLLSCPERLDLLPLGRDFLLLLFYLFGLLFEQFGVTARQGQCNRQENSDDPEKVKESAPHRQDFL